MRTKTIKANITIPIPYNKPDDNKICFTKESVENALKNLSVQLPILIDRDTVIGHTGVEHIVEWNDKEQICKLTLLDCTLFQGGCESNVKIENDKVISMDITAFGIATK